MDQNENKVVQQGYREFTKEEAKESVAKLTNRKAAGVDEIVSEFVKYGGEGMFSMMVMLYNWIWKTSPVTHLRGGEKE